MSNVIRFDHIKRCRRFFRILIGQHGLAYFVARSGRHMIPREAALHESVAFAADWMTLRTGDAPTDATRAVMFKELLAMVNHRLSTDVLEVMDAAGVAPEFPTRQ